MCNAASLVAGSLLETSMLFWIHGPEMGPTSGFAGFNGLVRSEPATLAQNGKAGAYRSGS